MYSYGNTEVVFPAALIEPKLSLKLAKVLGGINLHIYRFAHGDEQSLLQTSISMSSRLSSAELNLLMDEFRIAIWNKGGLVLHDLL